MSKCIYCGESEANSQEHILQESLGGRWRRKEIVCAVCNQLMGKTIDDKLAQDFIFFRNHLGIKKKKGGVPSFAAKTIEGETIRRNGQTGKLNLISKAPQVKIEKFNGKLKFEISGDFDSCKKILEKIKNKDTPAQPKEYTNIPNPIMHYEIQFTRDTYVAVLKSIVNFWAIEQGQQDIEVIKKISRTIHKYITAYNINKENEELLWDIANALGVDDYPLLMNISKEIETKIFHENEHGHTLVLVCKDATLYGGICLCGEIYWGFKLVEQYTGNIKVKLKIFNPFTSKAKDILNYKLVYTDFTFREITYGFNDFLSILLNEPQLEQLDKKSFDFFLLRLTNEIIVLLKHIDPASTLDLLYTSRFRNKNNIPVLLSNIISNHRN